MDKSHDVVGGRLASYFENTLLASQPVDVILSFFDIYISTFELETPKQSLEHSKNSFKLIYNYQALSNRSYVANQ